MELEPILSKLGMPTPEALLSEQVRRELGLGPLWQYGIGVSDINAARKELRRMGAGKTLGIRSKMKRWIEYGEPKNYTLSVAFAWVDDVELELLGEGQGSDFHVRDVPPGELFHLHHVATVAHDIDAQAARLDAAGLKRIIDGQINFGPFFECRVYYYEAAEITGGPHLELIHFNSFGRPFAPSARTNRRAAGLIGR